MGGATSTTALMQPVVNNYCLLS